MKTITIAIDGFSSCGKSTMAKDLAHEIGYVYVDSGAMYRAITLFALRNNLFDDNNAIDEKMLEEMLLNVSVSFQLNRESGLPDVYLNNECVEDEIRGMNVSSRVSAIAALPFVRDKLTQLQKEMGMSKGIVMDGRDIGTTVFPDAELKIFVTATTQVRAQRRYDELKGKNQKVSFDEILKNVQDRDYIDTHREVSPLRKAEDAVELDNSNMTIAQQKAWLLDMYFRRANS